MIHLLLESSSFTLSLIKLDRKGLWSDTIKQGQ